MPGGCQTCSAEGTPSNVRPVYSRAPSLKPGKLSGAGMIRYAGQLPVPRDRLVSLGEGGTPLISVPSLGREFGLRRMMIKDERLNPTGSWRDRYASLAVSSVAIEHEEAGVTVACAGDEALCVSVAAYAARAGLRSVSLVDGGLAENGSRVIDAIEGVGGRAVGVSGSDARWALLADAERDPAAATVVDIQALTVTRKDRTIRAGLPKSVQEAFLSGDWDATGQLLSAGAETQAVAARLPYVRGF